MSSALSFLCVLVCISASQQDRPPDVTVSCLLAQDCLLPCSFQPGGPETIQWFHQGELVYSSEPGADQNQKRAFVLPLLLKLGNATLHLRDSELKDRGTYTCQVQTARGEHKSKVVIKIKAPVKGVSLELSRLSGYEEFRCSVRGVFPAPRVTWTTEPPTFEELRPMTRMLADKGGLFTLDSRLRRLDGQPDLIYICRVSNSYGGPAWTVSLREREVRGHQGRDLTVPCLAPPSINSPSVSWSFSNGETPTHILTYDSASGGSRYSPPWDGHAELDGFRVRFGDASLRLMDPDHQEHSGSYTCTLSMTHNSHTERSDVIISGSTQEPRESPEQTSYWWIVGLIAALLVLALGAVLVYLKLRGKRSNPVNDSEEASELNPVKDLASQGDSAQGAVVVQPRTS